MSQPRVAVVGTGQWGQNHARTWARLGALGLICDSDQATIDHVRQAIPGLAAIPSTPSYDHVLDRPDIPAVVLATPAATHFTLARRALLAGKHVLVEKPITLSSADAGTLVRLAADVDRFLMVGHVLEYHPGILKIQEFIQAGRLGRVFRLHSNRLNSGKVRLEENALWSLAPHDVSVFLMLTGQLPTAIQCIGEAHLVTDRPGHYDVTDSHLKFPDGVVGQINVSWLHQYKHHVMSVTGSDGAIVLRDSSPNKELEFYPQQIAFSDDGVPTARQVKPEIIPYDSTQPLEAECRHFLDCLTQGRTPRSDGRDGWRVLRVLELCQASADSDGRRLEVDLTESRVLAAR